ncbi:hypothetical protein Ais01nite_49320 [Asanoa ishikariensis]|uniref:Trypsin-like peptidase domain-containing protein n=1 Tax=Asanoa ishikariensis TaxID=137265 RepID=A0A1H3RS61_9ACTN|nr:trypsin-like peptidase domain-containing protein [Asanoa ishikariensis]GIF66897.1 hypothetical protein Ais01nite_49320 [Asanoa ishikariensis]SDZ28450.1 Trypsin-like peptidase domain-containing protein [Asanoa ishikariensis]
MSAGDERTTWPETSPGYGAPPPPEGPIYMPVDRDFPPADLGPPPRAAHYAPPGPRGPVEPPVSWAPPPDFAPPAPRGPIDSAPFNPVPYSPVPPRPGPPFTPPAPRQPGHAIFETGSGAPPAADTRKGEKRRWVVGATLGLVVVLAGVVAYQAVRIEQLGDRLASNERVQADEQAQAAGRFDGLDGRATDLEKRLGAAFNPEAISSAALPSVFRVAAGDVTGTAFAVGKPASGGKTNMITNFHVVEDVYEAGGRQVFLERDSKRYAATIVAVNKAADVAHLRTSTKINGLVTAKGTVKSGQQIVVVGAPLGLSDSVTTGVVSAVRELPESNGPMIQFDAPINPGNSGGPVINSAKQVVGIATAKAQDAEGIGLAVPIKVACDAFKIC